MDFCRKGRCQQTRRFLSRHETAGIVIQQRITFHIFFALRG
jgi:hypothetical protein